MNGSVTPKVISCLWPLGSGLLGDFQQQVVLPEAERQGDGEDDQADDQAVAQLVEVLDQAQLVFVGDRPDAARHPEPRPGLRLFLSGTTSASSASTRWVVGGSIGWSTAFGVPIDFAASS